MTYRFIDSSTLRQREQFGSIFIPLVRSRVHVGNAFDMVLQSMYLIFGIRGSFQIFVIELYRTMWYSWFGLGIQRVVLKQPISRSNRIVP